MEIEERKKRIIVSNATGHAHVVTSDCTVEVEGNETIIKTVKDCFIKHLNESSFLAGSEVWTGEHHDIKMQDNTTYKLVRQREYDPYEKVANNVLD